MTKTLCRQYFQDFEMDPEVFEDLKLFRQYVFDPVKCDALVERYAREGRVYLAILQNQIPIGEVILKNINREKQYCTMGIHLQNNKVKNKGYGTMAEVLALQYAFNELCLKSVIADAILKNKRSQHVLEKVGFYRISEDERFVYYQCDKVTWTPPEL